MNSLQRISRLLNKCLNVKNETLILHTFSDEFLKGFALTKDK